MVQGIRAEVSLSDENDTARITPDETYSPDCGKGTYDPAANVLTLALPEGESWIALFRTEKGTEMNGSPLDKNQYIVEVACKLDIQAEATWVLDSCAETNYYDDSTRLELYFTGTGQVNITDTKAFGASVANNYYLLGAQCGICDIDIPMTLYTKNADLTKKSHSAINAVQSLLRGEISCHKLLQVGGDMHRQDQYGILFTGLDVSETDTYYYYEDEDAFRGKSLSFIKGTDFAFVSSAFSSTEGSIRVTGIETACVDTFVEDLEMAPAFIHLSGNVVLGGKEDNITVTSQQSKAEFTGVLSFCMSEIDIDGDVSMQHVQVGGGTPDTALTAIRASTLGEVTVGGTLCTRDNASSGMLHSLVADGGRISVAENPHHLEGDMKAATGHLYFFYNAATGKGPYGVIPEDVELTYWKTKGEALDTRSGHITVGFRGAEASFRGFTAVEPAEGEEGNNTIDLSFSRGAVWEVVPSNRPAVTDAGCYVSGVTSLAANQAEIYIGTISATWDAPGSFAASYECLRDTDTPAQLRTETLTGTGSTFHMRAEVGADADRMDSLVIEKESEGSHHLLVKGCGTGGKTETDNFLVQRQGGTAEFSLANKGGTVDIGVTSTLWKPAKARRAKSGI